MVTTIGDKPAAFAASIASVMRLSVTR